MPRLPIFRLGGTPEKLALPEMIAATPSIAMEGLAVGVDNLRHDVALSPRLVETARAHVMRVIGDPKQKIVKVAVVPGASGFTAETSMLEIPDVDVLVTGEPREWETVEYVADAVTEGKKKALVILGHIPSEQSGMDECTKWLKTFVNEVPVQFVPTKDPFWVQKGITPK